MKRVGLLVAVLAVAIASFSVWRSNEYNRIRSQFQNKREGYALVAAWVIEHGRAPAWVDLPKKQQELCGHSSALLMGTEGKYGVLFTVSEDSDGVNYIAYTQKPGVEMESIRADFFTIERLEPHWQICGAL